MTGSVDRVFFFNDTATTEIYTLSLHDALPIYDPVFGARPLKRTIQQRLENQLAAELLGGKFADGDTIKIDAKAHKFTFEKV